MALPRSNSRRRIAIGIWRFVDALAPLVVLPAGGALTLGGGANGLLHARGAAALTAARGCFRYDSVSRAIALRPVMLTAHTIVRRYLMPAQYTSA